MACDSSCHVPVVCITQPRAKEQGCSLQYSRLITLAGIDQPATDVVAGELPQVPPSQAPSRHSVLRYSYKSGSLTFKMLIKTWLLDVCSRFPVAPTQAYRTAASDATHHSGGGVSNSIQPFMQALRVGGGKLSDAVYAGACVRKASFLLAHMCVF